VNTTIATKERPKDFRGPSVHAILKGHKTQFREVVKLPDLQLPLQSWQLTASGCDFIAGFSDKIGTIEIVECPYGKPAEHLWVREAWAARHEYDNCRPIEIHKFTPIWYQSDELGGQFQLTGGFGKWRPSIFMPRWASRILLEITAIRVERLQSISHADARAEGVTLYNGKWWDGSHIVGGKWHTPVQAFCALFESINGPGSWDANPWVWVVEFRRVQP